MALALAGTVAGWSLTLSFGVLYHDKQIVLGLAGFSLCFTLVLLLHVIAYRRRGSHSAAPDTEERVGQLRGRPGEL